MVSYHIAGPLDKCFGSVLMQYQNIHITVLFCFLLQYIKSIFVCLLEWLQSSMAIDGKSEKRNHNRNRENAKEQPEETTTDT